jgi:hypothetical protein
VAITRRNTLGGFWIWALCFGRNKTNALGSEEMLTNGLHWPNLEASSSPVHHVDLPLSPFHPIGPFSTRQTVAIATCSSLWIE